VVLKSFKEVVENPRLSRLLSSGSHNMKIMWILFSGALGRLVKEGIGNLLAGDIEERLDQIEQTIHRIADIIENKAQSQTAAPTIAASDSPSIPANSYTDSTSVMILDYVTGSIGGAVGIVLLFGGVKIPKVSSFLTVFYGVGFIGFSIVWFSIANVSFDGWVGPYACAYGCALVLGLPVAVLTVPKLAGSPYTVTLLGGIAVMVLGVMMNTAGLFQYATEPCVTFTIVSGTGFAVGCLLYGVLTIFYSAERRYLAIAVFSFVGAYLFIKMIGIATGKYPSEWENLQQSATAMTAVYYVLFGCTFLVAGLAATFQLYIYPAGADDDYVPGGSVARQSSLSQSLLGTKWSSTSRVPYQPGFGSTYSGGSLDAEHYVKRS